MSGQLRSSTPPYFRKLLIDREPHLPPQGLQADDHTVEVLSLPEIYGLEQLSIRYSASLGTGGEGVDVLHALEGHGTGLDLLHRSWLHCVHQPVRSCKVISWRLFVTVESLMKCSRKNLLEDVI